MQGLAAPTSGMGLPNAKASPPRPAPISVPVPVSPPPSSTGRQSLVAIPGPNPMAMTDDDVSNSPISRQSLNGGEIVPSLGSSTASSSRNSFPSVVQPEQTASGDFPVLKEDTTHSGPVLSSPDANATMSSPNHQTIATTVPESVPEPSVPPPSATPDPYMGTTIDDRYRVDSVLGEGGMGVVYGGRHKMINKKVAIKILRGDLSRDKEMTERFLQEARAASSIGHPHICDVSDFGTLPDGSAYFVMEFLEGVSLSSIMQKDKKLETKRLIHIAKQVADGLQAAHEQSIVHRDLKPDNVFLLERGGEKEYVKILDFGIAKVVSSSTAKLTRAGTVFGTPHYMSPEQAAGAPVDSRTDIYSLGVILYEMASGQLPFDADNYMGILTQHMYKAPVPIRALVPTPNEVPPGLEAIILKTLSKKPEQRYSNMKELMLDLERLEKGELPTAVTEMIARSGAFNVPADYFASANSLDVVHGTPNFRRQPWGIYAGIAGIAAAVGIVSVIFFFGNKTDAKQGSQPGSSATAAVTAPAKTTAKPEVSSALAKPPEVKGKSVQLVSEPSDAEAFQDNESMGKLPIKIVVPEGKTLTIELRRDGYKTKELKIDGKKDRIDAKLVKTTKTGSGAAPNTANTNIVRPPPIRRPPPTPGGDIIDPWKH
jgi:eukaryotic-like serine/threonine-protein kinase